MPSFVELTRTALIAAGLCLTLGGCDRDGALPAQGEGGSGEEMPVLTSAIDARYAGEAMPTVSVRDPDGETLDLASLEGTPTLVNLWATWCAPCVVEMPMLDELAQDFGDDLRVVTVSQDLQAEKAVAPFFAKMQFAALEPWLDPDNALLEAMGGAVLPTTVLYDAQGREAWRVVGDYDWSSAETREAIGAVIAK